MVLEELAALTRMEGDFEQPFVHVACALHRGLPNAAGPWAQQ